MTAYCAYTDVQKVSKRIATTTDPAMDSTAITALIVLNQGTVDGILGKVYSVPFATVPDMVKTLTAQLTAGYILDYFYASNSPEESKNASTLYSRVIKMLKDFVKQKDSLVLRLQDVNGVDIVLMRPDVKLDLDGNLVFGDISTAADDPVFPEFDITTPYQPIFDKGATELQRVDPDEITDLNDEKFGF